jgi:hypothetical protein
MKGAYFLKKKKRIYNPKVQYEKKSFLTNEEENRLRNFLLFGSTDSTVYSEFKKNDAIRFIIKKSPYMFKKISLEEKPFNRDVVAFCLSSLLAAGKDGKHILNDIFLKYIKKSIDLFAFIYYCKQYRTSKDKLFPFVNKYFYNYSLAKHQKDFNLYEDNEYLLKFKDLFNYGLNIKDKKVEAWLGKIVTKKDYAKETVKLEKSDKSILNFIDEDILFSNNYYLQPFIFAENYNSKNYIIEKYNFCYKFDHSLKELFETKPPIACKERKYTIIYLDILINTALKEGEKVDKIIIWGNGKTYKFFDRQFKTDIPIIRVYFNKQKLNKNIFDINFVGFNKETTLQELQRVV